MGLESATFIADLVSTNPLFNDQKQQGDDHLRLLKSVLQATFPGMGGRLGRTQSKSAGYTAVLNDATSVIRFTSSATLSLTAAATLGNGWYAVVVNESTGDVTIDPAGTENVNDAATLVVPAGYWGFLYCTNVSTKEFVCLVQRRDDTEGSGAAITGNTTLTASDVRRLRQVTATATVTMPLVSAVKVGDQIRLKSLTTGDVQIARQGLDTLDGQVSNIRLPSYCTFVLEAVSGGWILLVKPDEYVGEMRPFGSTTLPLGWLACDFTAVSRTTYAGLFAVLSTNFGSGDGSTTFNVPDSRDRALVGDGTGTIAEGRDAADVNTTNDTLTVASNLDKWVTGMSITFTTSGTAPGGLTNGNPYFVIRASATTIKFASSLADAQNGTAIDLTSTGTGTHTITATLRARALGERGGEDAHAASLTETLAHTHIQNSHTHGPAGGAAGYGMVNSGGVTNILQYTAVGSGSTYGNGVNVQSTTASATPTNQNTGGNAAMNITQPYTVARYMVKT